MVTSPYSSWATHTTITSAVYKPKQAFALIDLLGHFIPFLFCFLLLSLMFSLERLVHLATMNNSAWPWGTHPWDIGSLGSAWIWDMVLCDCPVPLSLCFPGCCLWHNFSSEIHHSKQKGLDSALSTSLPHTSSCTPLFSAVMLFASHFTLNMREKSHYFWLRYSHVSLYNTSCQLPTCYNIRRRIQSADLSAIGNVSRDERRYGK